MTWSLVSLSLVVARPSFFLYPPACRCCLFAVVVLLTCAHSCVHPALAFFVLPLVVACFFQVGSKVQAKVNDALIAKLAVILPEKLEAQVRTFFQEHRYYLCSME